MELKFPAADYLVLFCHGLDGDPTNLTAIKEEILSLLGPDGKRVHLWDSVVNVGSGMRDGIKVCTDRLWSELLPLLKSKLAAHDFIVRVSFIGHSLGGLILRAVAMRLYVCA